MLQFQGHITLTGTLPTELLLSTNLASLLLDDHAISGTLPQEHGHFSHLKLLRIDRNLLSGSLPFGMGRPLRLSRRLHRLGKFSGRHASKPRHVAGPHAPSLAPPPPALATIAHGVRSLGSC